MPRLDPDEDDMSMSDGLDEIPAKPETKSKKRKAAPEPEPEPDEDLGDTNGAEEDDDEEDDEDEETFAVEKIIQHDFTEKGIALYKVKWLGYDSEADQTWEPEENLSGGAADILQAYWTKIGGKPVDNKTPKGARGRKRKSEAATDSPAPDSAKGTKRTKAAKGKKWEAPSGSWEDHVQVIQTIQEDQIKDKRGRGDARLQVYIVFNDGHKAAFAMSVVRQKCPQKLLDYYEQHLTFKDPTLKEQDDMQQYENSADNGS